MPPLFVYEESPPKLVKHLKRAIRFERRKIRAVQAELDRILEFKIAFNAAETEVDRMMIQNAFQWENPKKEEKQYTPSTTGCVRGSQKHQKQST